MKSIDYNARTFKRPTTDHDDYIGIEIECFIPKGKFDIDGYLCRDCQGDCECDMLMCDCMCFCNKAYIDDVAKSIEKMKIPGIQIVTDGSIESGDSTEYIELEIKVLTRKNNKSNLKLLCQWLKKHKALVNNTCGLHVHLDCRINNAEEVKNRLLSKLDLLKKIVPKYRLSNQYCQDGESSNCDDKYRMINLTSYNKYRTIEVRLHQGTVDYSTISNYIDLLSHIKDDKNPTIKMRNYVLKELKQYNHDVYSVLKNRLKIDKKVKKSNINKKRKRAA